MLTLGEIVSEGLAEGNGIKVRTKTGKWSKVYPECGFVWRPRGHTHFVADPATAKSSAWDAGRRYLPDDTEVCVVRLLMSQEAK